jgi:hypothetical protein
MSAIDQPSPHRRFAEVAAAAIEHPLPNDAPTRRRTELAES